MTVLVAYASKHGSTRGIAERIAARLRERGNDVEFQPVDQVRDVRAYDAVVAGSAVYYGRWLKQAAEFVRRNQALLAERPVWLFSSGPLGTQAEQEPADVAGFRETIRLREHRTFLGSLDRSQLALGERVIVRAVRAPYGDFRRWGDIDAWAGSIADRLAEEARAASGTPSRVA